ncbi:MAG: hypothetical protein WAL63_11150 [Solirubrobacteraceae bacterium]
MDLEALSKDDWILGGIAVTLVIDLLFLPWLRFSAGRVTLTSTATGTPAGWLGVLAMLAVLALIADLALERFSPQTQLPAVEGSRTQTRFLMACVAAVLLTLKFLLHIHLSRFGIGFWGAALLTAALVYVARQAHNAERTAGRT